MILFFDIYFFRLINGFAGQSKFLDFIAIFLANTLSYILVFAALVIIFLNKSWRNRLDNFLFIGLTVLLSTGLFAQIIRAIHDRPRPSLVLENVMVLLQKNMQEPSFPSDHAVFFFSLAMAIYFVDRKWFKYFLVSAILMGVARVFVGVHYPLDIVAGAMIGVGAGLLTHKIYRYNNRI